MAPGSGALAWITRPSAEPHLREWTHCEGRALGPPSWVVSHSWIRGQGTGALASAQLQGAGPRWTEGAGCPPHMCAGQIRWHLRHGQRACRSHYPGPLGKQLQKKYLAIWTGVRLQNGSFLCDSLLHTDEREGLLQIFITPKSKNNSRQSKDFESERWGQKSTQKTTKEPQQNKSITLSVTSTCRAPSCEWQSGLPACQASAFSSLPHTIH